MNPGGSNGDTKARVGVPTVPVRVAGSDGEEAASDVPEVQAARLAEAEPEADCGAVTWARLDDTFPEHPKIEAVGPLGAWLHVRMICYCARNLTDGFVPEGAALRMAADLPPQTLERNISVRVPDCTTGLLDRVDGGYMVHDFLTYNPSREVVTRDRAAAAERMRHIRSGERSGERTPERSGEVRQPRSRSRPTPDPIPSKTDPPAAPTDLVASKRRAQQKDAPGFSTVWAAYPHYGTRSAKAKARIIWERRKLEPLTESVLDWIAFAQASNDWLKEAGKYVPGAQVWLAAHDFSEPPPLTAPNPMDKLSPAGQETARVLQAWLAKQEA